jgi:TonB family protein
MSENPTKIRLSKTIVWVTLAHVFFLLLIGFWPARKMEVPPTVTMIEMIDAVGPIPSSKGPQPEPKVATGPVLGKPEEPPAPSKSSSTPPPAAPPSEPAPPAPPIDQKTPEPVKPTPEEQPTPAAPQPETETNDFAPKEPQKENKPPVKKSIPKTETKTETKTESKKTAIKVNLKEVVRKNTESNASESNPSNATSKTSKPSKSHSTASNHDSDGDASPDAILSKLSSAVGKSGQGGAVQIGPLSTPGGGNGNFGSYFGLIRKQMYDAWNRPVHLTQKDLSALLKITIENDGRISNVALVTGSGIRDFDESIVAAARRVGRIREPLPEGLDHEITIRFKLDD